MLFSKEERYLLCLLEEFLSECINSEPCDESIDIDVVVKTAKKHSVLSFLYDSACQKALFVSSIDYIEKECRQIVLQSYHLLFLTRGIINLLKEQGILSIVLKGAATAGMYRTPELRKSGDIDLLIPETASIKKVTEIMQEAGFIVKDKEHANYHVSFRASCGIDIEIHTMLTEEFASKRLNEAMKKHMKLCWDNIEMLDVMGVVIPSLNKPYHAYELLLHMFHHFTRTGFGLKLLCDWVVLWKQEWTKEEKQTYNNLIEECGLGKFASLISETCIRFLGMNDNIHEGERCFDDVVDNFVREILDAGEFGFSDSTRMVVMHGTGLLDYIREFHYQMHLNFPKAGKWIVLWPVLWGVTFVRFIYNNHKLRKTSTGDILREATRRSKLMKQLKLFK